MTQVASRTDFQYLMMFVAGLVVVYAGGPLVSALVSLAPLSHPGETYLELQAAANAANIVATVAGTLMYALAFIGLAAFLGRLSAVRPTRAGVYTGAITVGGLMLALLLTSFNVAQYVRPDLYLSIDWTVWTDLAAVVALGLFYMAGWFLACHIGQKPARRSARRSR